MTALKWHWLVFILGLTFSVQSKAISIDSATLKPNVIHGHVGFFGLWGTAHVSYERLLFVKNKNRLNHFYLHTGAGAFVTWGSSGPTFVSQFKGITGKKNGHFEWGGGVAVLFDKLSYDITVSNARGGYEEKPRLVEYCIPIPAFTVGYRFQKPDGHFVFRTGIASPDGLYVSLGVAF
jgi:hypothetical protein